MLNNRKHFLVMKAVWASKVSYKENDGSHAN